MDNNTLIALWAEGRTRFTNQLQQITGTDLKKQLLPAPNTAGFLIRHIADVELLFAKNVFALPDVTVHAKTVITKRDTGEWTNLDELMAYQHLAYSTLRKAIEIQPVSGWNETVTTQEFGPKTKSEALARITTHTAYHAGQLAIILKYGK